RGARCRNPLRRARCAGRDRVYVRRHFRRPALRIARRSCHRVGSDDWPDPTASTVPPARRRNARSARGRARPGRAHARGAVERARPFGCRNRRAARQGCCVTPFERDASGALTLIGGYSPTSSLFHFPLLETCPYSGATDVERVELSREGTLWAWTAVT